MRKQLLLKYLDERVRFYTTRDPSDLVAIDERTARLQSELWSLVRSAASERPTPLMAITVMGMNDVLNSQGYTLAAWRNRIPIAAWCLMIVIALCAVTSVGFGLRRARSRSHLLPVLPLVRIGCGVPDRRYRQPAAPHDSRRPAEPAESVARVAYA